MKSASVHSKRGGARRDAVDDKARLQATIADWVERGWLRRLDAAFAGFLWQEVPDAPPLLILGALLASHQLGCGHACLDLEAALQDPALTLALPPEGAAPVTAESPAPYPAQVLEHVTLAAWLAALCHPQLVGTGEGNTPLVLADTRLYLRRCPGWCGWARA